MMTNFSGSRTMRRARRMVFTLCGVVSLTSSAAYGGQWTSHGPNGAIVKAFAVDPTSPSTIYAGTERSGMFKSLDGGATWTALFDGMPPVSGLDINGIAVDPVTPANVYAAANFGVGGLVLRSTDGGAHWTFANAGIAAWAIAIDPATPTTLYVGSAPHGLKSIDAGATWTPIEPFASFAIAIDPTSPATVYAVSGAVVMKTIDRGATWKTTGSFGIDLEVHAIAIDPTTTHTVYAGTTAGIFKSVDAGDHWTLIGPPPGQFGIRIDAIAIDPANHDVVYAAATIGGGAFKSIDGGAHWALTSLPTQAFAFALLDSDRLLVGTLDGVFVTTDGAATWIPSNAGLVGTVVTALAVDPANRGKLYAGTLRSSVASSADGGDTWTPSTTVDPSGIGISAIAVDPTAPGTLYTGPGVTNGVFKTVDDGVTWARLTGENAPLNGEALLLDPTDPSIVWAGVAFGGVFRSPDGGTTWTPKNAGIFPVVVSLTIDPSAPSTLYAGTAAAGAFKTTDAGEHWAEIDSGLPPMADAVQSLTMDPANPSILYTALPGVGVFKTTDGGASWHAATNGIPPQFLTAVAADAVVTGTVYAATFDQGVFTSFDGGDSWVPTNDGLFNLNVRSLATEPGRVYAGTYGSGTFAMAVASTTTTTSTTTSTLAPVVLGRTLRISDPAPDDDGGGDPSKRKVVVTAKEPASTDALDAARLTASGATLTITTFGANPTGQTFSMPGPWKPVGTTGARYVDKAGVNGPVKTALVKRSSSGVFQIRVTISGKVSGDLSQPQVLLVPPNPGVGARVVLQIAGGASYCMGFGGDAGGQVSNRGTLAFTVSRPTAAVCP